MSNKIHEIFYDSRSGKFRARLKGADTKDIALGTEALAVSDGLATFDVKAESQALKIQSRDENAQFIIDPTQSPSIFSFGNRIYHNEVNISSYRYGADYYSCGIKFNAPRSGSSDGATHAGRGYLYLLGNSTSTISNLFLGANSAGASITDNLTTVRGYQSVLEISSGSTEGMTYWRNGTAKFQVDENTTRIKNAFVLDNSITVSAPNNDDIDVNGVNVVLCDTNSNHVHIRGFKNGVAGQIIRVLKIFTASNTLYIDHNVAVPNQRVFTKDGINQDLTFYGGVSLYCTGTAWYQIGEY